MKHPKVSVILTIYNDNNKAVSKSINSIKNQIYKNWEIVVVNGGQKVLFDGVKIVEAEPKGIADAFNVGVRKAVGEYLYFMGAGDFLEDNLVFTRMMENVDVDKDWLITGKIKRIDKNGVVLYEAGGWFKKCLLLYKMAIPHQGLFMSKKYFDKYGLFDEKCKYAMDYELLLRAYKDFPKVVQKNMVVANWVEGGVGQNDTDKVLDEYHRIRIKNKIAPRWILELIYLLSKLRYGIK
ncbi:glycosyltransferase [Candidatus Shapirobacteria bacterium]|nr:glycosyltransferase [Candidatus Shapirobacteria bacterium]